MPEYHVPVIFNIATTEFNISQLTKYFNPFLLNQDEDLDEEEY